MMINQKYRDARTGEIVEQLPILDVRHFDEYNGPAPIGMIVPTPSTTGEQHATPTQR